MTLQKPKNIGASWSKEALLVLVGTALLAAAPSAVFALKCTPGDNYHIHAGADHCDSGGSGCTVVCE